MIPRSSASVLFIRIDLYASPLVVFTQLQLSMLQVLIDQKHAPPVQPPFTAPI